MSATSEFRRFIAMLKASSAGHTYEGILFSDGTGYVRNITAGYGFSLDDESSVDDWLKRCTITWVDQKQVLG